MMTFIQCPAVRPNVARGACQRSTPCQMRVAFTLSAIKVVTRRSQRLASSPEDPIGNGPHDPPECPKVAACRHGGVTSPQPFLHRPDLHESANRNRCPESCLPPERRPKQEQQAGPRKGDKHGEVPVPGELVVAREEAIEEHEAAVSDEECERPLISQTRVRSPHHRYRSTFLDRRIYARHQVPMPAQPGILLIGPVPHAFKSDRSTSAAPAGSTRFGPDQRTANVHWRCRSEAP